MESGQTYKAFITDYGVGETATGLTKIWAKFTIKDSNETVKWTGVMKDGKAAEFTMNTLTTMGFNGSFEDLNEGHMTEALDIRKEFDITVENNTFINSSGEEISYMRVKWINTPVTAKNFDRMEPEKVHMKKASFDALWKAHQIADKMKNKEPAQKAKKVANDLSDIPF